MAVIQPGLERISQLVKDVKFPWKAIHVAGTNGKGSICHYASSLLTRRTIKCGKFTSPHLVDRWDCIQINGRPVNEALFKKVEKHYAQISQRESIDASPFEILTATAFHIFNEENVEVGVVEVGMGGKLDATNILNNQIVSVISKIAQDHQSFLGNTLEEIALHKAGILRPNVPYIVNPANEWHVRDTIDRYAKEIGAGPRLELDTQQLKQALYANSDWQRFADWLRPFQRDNALLAVLAVDKAAEKLRIEFEYSRIAQMLLQIRHNANPGRLQYIQVPPVFGTPNEPGRKIIIDGAHNPDAAAALVDFMSKWERKKIIPEQQSPQNGWPVTWVLAMTEGKDARQYLQHLLMPGDNVITTSFGPIDGMPWVKPMDPKVLLETAKAVEPGITGLAIPDIGPLRALCAAKYITGKDHPIVLTGSLYLVGDFHRELRSTRVENWWEDPEYEDDRALLQIVDVEEQRRVNQLLSSRVDHAANPPNDQQAEKDQSLKARLEERIKIREELRALNREIGRLDKAEQRISHTPEVSDDGSVSSSEMSDEATKGAQQRFKIRKHTAWDKRKRGSSVDRKSPT